MNEQIPRPDPDRLRASDADRERVAAVLHDAMGEGRLTLTEVDERLVQVYSAKTIGDLRPIIADLPGHDLAVPTPASRTQTSPAGGLGSAAIAHRIGGAPTSRSAIAILGGAVRRGAWVLPEKFPAVAIMGGIELDLTEAAFAAPETTIEVFALMGGVQITVPDTVQVVCTAFGVMGGVDNKARGEAPAGAPVVRVTGVALMGGVEISPPKRRRLRGR